MADKEKEVFPVIPAKQWWALRRKFQQSIPSAVTPGYLATALGMAEASAKSNILSSLVRLGIVQEDGKPNQERAVAWRDDERYPEVCQAIRKEVYPTELLDAIPGPEVDRAATERWFGSRTAVGKVGAQKMAVVYEILTQADPKGGEPKPRSQTPSSPTAKRAKAAKPDSPEPKREKPATSSPTDTPKVLAQAPSDPHDRTKAAMPSLHIDIQVHISPEATADQIDAIFASMAKHLFQK